MSAPMRVFCHAGHYCHHWFEDECADACDRGEHNYPHGHEGCDRPSTPDPRITDVRVKAGVRENWLVGEDPNPQYSRLDNMYGLPRFTADIVLPTVDDSLNPPASPVRVVRGFDRVTPEPPHSMFEAFRVLLWIVAIGVPAVVVFTVGFMVGRWVA